MAPMTETTGPADVESFVDRYGGLYEHSPWIVRRTVVVEGLPSVPLTLEQARTFADAMANTLSMASYEEKLTLIRAHPDLVGRAALAGELTHESTAEQASAGLTHCSAEELARFQAANDQYHERFGFPFVLAVRERDRASILEIFEQRLSNDVDIEFETALSEINTIALLRLEAMVKSC